MTKPMPHKTSYAPRALRLLAVFFLAVLPLAWQAPTAVQAAKAPRAALPARLYTPAAGVSLNIPAQVAIGANFSFTATFDNTAANAAGNTGYGPFIDLYFPVTGTDGNDGVDFLSATYLGQAVTATQLTFPGPGPTGCVNHPYAVAPVTGAALQVCGISGDKLVVLLLPFGSFTPDQPPAVVTVNASLSNLADLGAPLTIHARGGYEFGATPMQDWCCTPFDATILSQPGTDGTAWSPSGSVTPYVVKLAKTYNGPENETASGPNYPRRYTVRADIANGQVISGLVLNDILPDNMQFVQMILPTTPAGASCTTPSTTVPGGTVSCTFASVTGGAGASDATFTFEFYIPLDDTGPAPVIDPASGDVAQSLNNATASGNWQPIDPRDPLSPFTVDNPGPEHTLNDKSIAIQKAVADVINVGPAGYTPGDTLDYTLSFQVSDFFSFQNVAVADVISDGQHFDPSFTPTLSINGNTYALAASGMNAANYTVDTSQIGNDPNPATDGSTTITFRVSDEIITRGQSGKLIGGCVPVPGTGGPTPNCDIASGGYDDGPTTGTIHFRTVIQDQFTDTYPSGDPSVDHGDVLTDAVTAGGDLLSVSDNATPTGQSQADTSAASISIAFGTLTKSIYAIDGSTSFSSPAAIAPGDTITFRLRYTLPTSDFETLVLTDYMPLPILHASELTSFDDVGGFGNPLVIPAAGHVNFGPADTFRALAGTGIGCTGGAPNGSPPANADGTPCMTTDAASNLVAFNYGNFDDPTNTDTEIDLLFTTTVSNDPFADALFLTNQANASEGTTNAGSQNLDGIIQMVLTEPVLVFGKSVIASNDPNAVYAPTLPPLASGVSFNAPGTAGARWTGNINSNFLATYGLNSDVTGIQANDLVSFALVIENQGTSAKGAFDIDISDNIPPGFHVPAGGLNLRATYGDNSTSLAYTKPDDTPAVDTDLFAGGIRLVDPGGATGGVCQVHSLTSGKNVVIITYDLQVDGNVNPSQTITNTGVLSHYAGEEGGPNFLSSNLTDDASVTIGQPLLDKILTGTEINNATNDNTHAVIGELVTYTLTVTVPQGVVPGGQLTDTLDDGLAFVDVQSVTYSPGVSSANTIGTGASPANVTVGSANAGTGNQPVFDFGDITNSNSDSSVADTIVIVYRAVVLNVAGNQGGTQLNNSAVLTWGAGGSVAQTAPTANVTVIEPALQDTKSVTVNGAGTTGDAGDPAEYTIVLSQAASSQTDAFDATFDDPIPADIQPSGFTVTDSLGLVTAADFSLSGNNLTSTSPFDFPFNATRTITIVIDGTLKNTVSPSQSITNTANLHWTSLSGAVVDRSGYNTSSDERDGSGTPALNDYTASAAASLTILGISPIKSIVSTSEASTSESGDGSAGNPRDLAIGEIVRYRLAIDLPEGSSTNFTVTDTLPAGLSYLANGSGAPKVSFLADTPMTVPADLAGADNDALPPTFDIPAAHLSVSGQTVTISLGNLINNDSDSNAETVVIEYNVLVNNDANANNTDLKNNLFTVTINGSPAGTSNSVGVRIVEPSIPFNAATNNKTVSLSNSPADAGDVATYTVTYTNSGLADAFEARVLDSLPAAYLDLTAVNAPTYNAACLAPTLTDASDLSSEIVDVTIDRVRVGCTVTFTYTATLRTTVTPNQTLTNTAAITYTSLPGTNGTTSNATGSSTPGAGGSSSGERDGSGGASDDYNGSDTAAFTTRTVARAKSIVDTEINTTGNSNTQLSIGELVTYQLVITVPEGTTPNLQVVDTLGTNMVVTDVCASGYPSAATPIAASTGVSTSLAGGFADACNDGTAVTNNPVVSAFGGTAGRRITWSLGTITNTDTNNANPETITIQYQAVALDVAANQAGGTRTNSAVVSWTGNALAAATTSLTLVEATLNTAKSVSAGPYDAGDTLTYTLTLTNPAAGSTTAFDATLNDPLPAFFSSAALGTVTGGGFTGTDFSVSGCPGACVLQTAAAGGIDIPANTTVTITLQATLSGTVSAGQIVANTATTQWTSVNGSVVDRSPYNAGSDERDGSGGLLGGGALNDYRTQGTVSFTLSTPLVAKQAPTPATYAIGGLATYPILVTLPEGLTQSLRVIDQVPAGMLYVSSSVDATGFAGTVTATPAVTPAAPVDGDDITFDFGDTSTTADGNAANNSFILNVTLRVLDVPANQTGTTLTNAAALRYLNPNTGVDAADVSGGSQNITITEPRIVANKSVDLTTGVQAGDVLTYTVSFTNTNSPLADVSTAYEVSATDVLAQGVAFTSLTSCALDTPATDLTALTSVDTSISGQVTFSGSAWDVPPGSAITCIYKATAQPGVFIDGTHVNTVDADWTSLNGVDANERVYDDSVARSVDGTQDTATASFSSDSITLAKGADVSQLAIGGTVTFTLTIHGPNGTIRNLRIADQLPAGLIYNNDAVFSGISAPSSTTVGSPNDGTASVDLNWNFGDATKSAEPFTIVYSARAADVLGNQIGTVLTNAVSLDHDFASGAAAPQLTDSTTLTITEPVISFAKSIVSLPSPLDAGGVVQYRLSYANSSGANVSTAHEVQLTDTLPAQLGLNLPPTITLGGGAAGASDASSGNNLDVSIASVPPGGSVTIDYSGTIQGTVSPGDVITNTSNSSWTSLSGTVSAERSGAGGVDDYAATSSQNFTIATANVITKQIISTSAAHTSGTNVTIGEQITYGLLVTFPEGTTPADSVVDNLPVGLAVVSGTPQVITTAVASSGLLSADFNGTFGTQNITVVPGDGGSVSFDYTNVVVAGDNDAANNTVLLTFAARVTDVAGNVGFPTATTLSNSATNTEGASSTTSNSVDVTVVEPRPVLAKSFANQTTPASGASGILGDVIRLTLTYENTGTANAYDVVMTDALDSSRFTGLTPVTTPAGFTYSSSGGNPVTIQYAANPGVAVAPGATLTFELDFTLSSANTPGDVIPDTANVTQTTTLDSSSSDGDDANERNTTTNANASLQFNGAELSITKSDGGITTAPGNTLTYTLNYSNYGNLDDTNVLLRETVPANTSYLAADNTTAWVCGADPAPAGTGCAFSLGTLAAGATGSVSFVVRVANPLAASVTELGNTAAIQGDQPETVTTDNSSSVTTPVVAAPALTITKDDGVQIVAPANVLTYTITVTNSGNQDLKGLQLVDTIPAGTSFVSASASGSFDSGAGQVSWPVFTLASGASTSFSLRLQVADLAALGGITSFTNAVHVQDDGSNTSGAPVQATASDTDQLANTGVKTLTGTNQAGSATPNVLIGEILDYAIRIDVPVGTIADLKAVDVLDHGLAFVGCDPVTPISSGSLVLAQNPCTTPAALTVQAEPVTDTNPASPEAGRHITFDFGSVQNNSAATQSLILNYQVIVLDIADNVNAVSGLNNAVEWQWEGGTLAGSATGVDIVEPQLQIQKTVSPQVALLGTTVTFTIDIRHSPQSSAPAYDVNMTDGIPGGLQLVPGSITVTGSAGLPAATVSPTATQFSVYWASFPVGETATITFQASFIGPSPVVNRANVEWSSIQIDPNPHMTPQSPYNIHSTERRYDPLSQTLNNYRASDAATLRVPSLPNTGFAPGRKTFVPEQPLGARYDTLGDMWLEIPKLGLKMPIVGIPAGPNGWDLTWLTNEAGYLEGTTYPSQVGTTGLTGHVYLADGTPGPFLHLGDLAYGDAVILHANGQRYVFEVRTRRVVLPGDTSVFSNDGYTWLTLLTCKDYIPSLNRYDYRLAVRAVLLRVETEATNP